MQSENNHFLYMIKLIKNEFKFEGLNNLWQYLMRYKELWMKLIMQNNLRILMNYKKL